MLSESVKERLKLFQNGCFQIAEREFSVQEKAKEGIANIACQVGGDAIVFTIEGKKGFQSLWIKKCADAIVFEQCEEDRWNLHIIECKRTVRERNWEDIKEQFSGAILHAYAIMGILGIQQFDKIQCYTAFRTNLLDPEESPNPILYKMPEEDESLDITFDDWFNGRISLLFLDELEHHKIRLDDMGNGEVMLE